VIFIKRRSYQDYYAPRKINKTYNLKKNTLYKILNRYMLYI